MKDSWQEESEFQTKVHGARERQIEEWGNTTHPEPVWMAILMKQLGKVASAMSPADYNPTLIIAKLSECAAVIQAWAGDLSRSQKPPTVEEDEHE